MNEEQDVPLRIQVVIVLLILLHFKIDNLLYHKVYYSNNNYNKNM